MEEERLRGMFDAYQESNIIPSEKERSAYQSMNPENITGKCHNVCQTTIQGPGKVIFFAVDLFL